MPPDPSEFNDLALFVAYILYGSISIIATLKITNRWLKQKWIDSFCEVIAGIGCFAVAGFAILAIGVGFGTLYWFLLFN